MMGIHGGGLWVLNKSLPDPGWGCPLRLRCLISDIGGCCPTGLRNEWGWKSRHILFQLDTQ